MDEEQNVIAEIDVSNVIEEVKTINDTNDIFDTYSKAETISNFLELDANKEILEKNNLIAIYGSWGTGKSCLMRTIEDKIDKNKFETIWFDTWKYEKDENLGFSLLKYVVKDRVSTQLKEKGRDFFDNAYGVFKSLAKGVTAEIELGGILLNINAADALEQAEVQTQRIEERKEKEKRLWERIEEFEKNFKKLTFNNKRLVVFLDDLDRCESENIITLMSSIKLLLSVNPNIIFVLGVDKNAVTLALRNKYGNDENKADEYLEKIFPITFEITNKLKTENFKKYISSITGLSTNNSQFIVDFFYTINFTNSRHIKKVMRKYYFVKEYLISKGYDLNNKFNVVFVLYNIILNTFYNDEYQHFILDNPSSKYEEMIIYQNLKSGNVYEQNFSTCEILGNNQESSNGFYASSYLLWQQFSSYKLLNKRLKAISITEGVVAYVYYTEWRKQFEESICKIFLDFIIRTDDFYQYFLDENNNYKNQYILDFIKAINDVI